MSDVHSITNFPAPVRRPLDAPRARAPDSAAQLQEGVVLCAAPRRAAAGRQAARRRDGWVCAECRIARCVQCAPAQRAPAACRKAPRCHSSLIKGYVVPMGCHRPSHVRRGAVWRPRAARVQIRSFHCSGSCAPVGAQSCAPHRCCAKAAGWGGSDCSHVDNILRQRGRCGCDADAARLSGHAAARWLRCGLGLHVVRPLASARSAGALPAPCGWAAPFSGAGALGRSSAAR